MPSARKVVRQMPARRSLRITVITPSAARPSENCAWVEIGQVVRPMIAAARANQPDAKNSFDRRWPGVTTSALRS